MARSVRLRRLAAGPGTAVAAFVSAAWRWWPLPLPGVAAVIGAALLFATVSMAAAVHSLYPERHESPSDFPELITTGPYRLCRHPFYASMMGVQFSLGLSMHSLPGLAVAAALLPLWLAVIRLEEGELLGYWGEKYRRYMEETPMLLPRLSALAGGGASRRARRRG